MRTLAKDCKEGKIEAEKITEEVLESYLDTHGIPDPDLLIRTSGELRALQLSALAACLHRILFYRCVMAGLYEGRIAKGD